MDDSDQSGRKQRLPRHHRRRHIGCIVLALLIAAVIALLVWINSQQQQTGNADTNVLTPMPGPPEAGPARPAQ